MLMIGAGFWLFELFDWEGKSRSRHYPWRCIPLSIFWLTSAWAFTATMDPPHLYHFWLWIYSAKRQKKEKRLTTLNLFILPPLLFWYAIIKFFLCNYFVNAVAVVPFRFSFVLITFFIFHISEDNRKKSRAALAAKVAVETSSHFKPERKAVSVRLHQLKSISL